MFTHPSDEVLQKVRSPLDFLAENYEHELSTLANKLLDSGKKE